MLHNVKVIFQRGAGKSPKDSTPESKKKYITVEPEVLMVKPGDAVVWSFYCCEYKTTEAAVEFKIGDGTDPTKNYFRKNETHKDSLLLVNGKGHLLGIVPQPGPEPLQEDPYTVRAIVNGKEIFLDPKIIKDHP